ncbi:hypothetical protein C5167_049940 [Papaver somniferum]|uniref:Uncharacterized protein n=1 Tax=Papaver somniferum TaxID=3469 RepID=A0A4Y7KNM8_PAPSO|nr:hypothetical protein C5167_049940 [Papaver somniferum]
MGIYLVILPLILRNKMVPSPFLIYLQALIFLILVFLIIIAILRRRLLISLHMKQKHLTCLRK